MSIQITYENNGSALLAALSAIAKSSLHATINTEDQVIVRKIDEDKKELIGDYLLGDLEAGEAQIMPSAYKIKIEDIETISV